MRKFLQTLPAIVFFVFAIIAASYMLSGKDPLEIESPVNGQAVPAFSIEGMAHTDIQGPALINFFASWCIPCEAEHPLLKQLSSEAKIYGIAYNNPPAERDKFLARLGNPYIRTGSDMDGSAAIAFGVYGVPTTFGIDANNVIIYRHDGPMMEEDIEEARRYLK